MSFLSTFLESRKILRLVCQLNLLRITNHHSTYSACGHVYSPRLIPDYPFLASFPRFFFLFTRYDPGLIIFPFSHSESSSELDISSLDDSLPHDRYSDSILVVECFLACRHGGTLCVPRSCCHRRTYLCQTIYGQMCCIICLHLFALVFKRFFIPCSGVQIQFILRGIIHGELAYL